MVDPHYSIRLLYNPHTTSMYLEISLSYLNHRVHYLRFKVDPRLAFCIEQFCRYHDGCEQVEKCINAVAESESLCIEFFMDKKELFKAHNVNHEMHDKLIQSIRTMYRHTIRALYVLVLMNGYKPESVIPTKVPGKMYNLCDLPILKTTLIFDAPRKDEKKTNVGSCVELNYLNNNLLADGKAVTKKKKKQKKIDLFQQNTKFLLYKSEKVRYNNLNLTII